jgi:hypothetical protein
MRLCNTVGIPHRVQFIIIHILKDSKAERDGAAQT